MYIVKPHVRVQNTYRDQIAFIIECNSALRQQCLSALLEKKKKLADLKNCFWPLNLVDLVDGPPQ